MRWLAHSLAIVLGVFACDVNAQNKFVNGACANDGDGSGPGCAASSRAPGAFNDIPYTSADCAFVNPGDVIELADNGTFDYETPNQNNGYDMDPGCAGTAGNPVVFQSASGADIYVTGALDDTGESWTNPGGNEWLCSSCGRDTPNRPSWIAFYANGGPEIEVLYQSINPATASCGSAGLGTNRMYMETAANSICVNLGGLDPRNMDYFRVPHARIVVDARDNPHQTWRRHPDGTGSFTFGRSQAKVFNWNAEDDGTRLEHVNLEYTEDRCLEIQATSQAIGTEEMYFGGSPGDPATVRVCGQEGLRYTGTGGGIIEHVEISDIQTPTYFPVCSAATTCPAGDSDNATAIRLARNVDPIVENVEIFAIGGGLENNGIARGIDCESDNTSIPQTACEGGLFRYIYMHSSTPGTFYAFYIGGSVDGRNVDRVIVEASRFNDVDYCLRFPSSGGSYQTGTFTWRNNTCRAWNDAGLSMGSTAGPITLRAYNNVFISDVNQTSPVIEILAAAAATQLRNNLFYCPLCDNTDVIVSCVGPTQCAESSYQYPGGCTPGTNCIDDLDSASAIGDPQMTNVIGSFDGDLLITADTSPAYNTGDNTECSPADFLGTVRPQDGTCDMGAHELVTMPPVTSGGYMFGG